jgi:small ligand-binding sensory domain FIST
VTITEADGNVSHSSPGDRRCRGSRGIICELGARERALVAGGLLVGIVIDGGKPGYEQGDFLVRGLLGADPGTGRIAVSASVRPGQVVRLHARDARSADDDLRRELSFPHGFTATVAVLPD